MNGCSYQKNSMAQVYSKSVKLKIP